MSTFLEVALEAVKAAEKVIVQYYQTDLAVEDKVDMSPVTIADKEAEAAVRRIILEHFPDHVVYGEEGAKDVGSLDQYTWIVDPIDGTKFFIRGIPLFGTLLALMKNGEIILGVSNMPMMKELLYAERGKGAFLNGKPIKVSGITNLSEAYLSHGTVKYFTQIGQRDNLLRCSETVKSARGLGDCWPYHLIAQGKLDAFLEAKMKIWDIAPYVCIIQEAGGEVTQLDGTSVNMDATSCLATNGHLHTQTLAAFS